MEKNKENWTGLVGVIIIPVFLLGLGLSLIVGGFNNSSSSQNNNPQIGIGGGPPTLTPTPSLFPKPSSMYRDQ